MSGRAEFYIEGLGAYRVPDRLAREGIAVLSARPVQKKGILVQVAAKDRKKVFAILKSSCYNVKNMRPRGSARLAAFLVARAGLAAGALLFFLAIALAQTRVLRVEVVGSGAYLRPRVEEILTDFGVSRFSAFPRDTGPLKAEILSLPQVVFCSVGLGGGVVTVDVEVSGESGRAACGPLFAPCAGKVEELVVVRGKAVAAVGDEVKAGQPVVSCEILREDGTVRTVAVIARVRIGYPFAKEYPLGEEEARAQALLDFGEIGQLHTTKTGKGWLLEGIAFAEAALNFG